MPAQARVIDVASSPVVVPPPAAAGEQPHDPGGTATPAEAVPTSGGLGGGVTWTPAMVDEMRRRTGAANGGRRRG